MPIATRLDQNVDHIAVLVDRTPEILTLASNGDEELVQVPRVAQPTFSPLQPAGVIASELPAPLADGLVGDGDAPLRQEVLHVSQAQAKPEIEPDGVADDLGREPVSVVARSWRAHPGSLPATPST
jgi:hypothetical protein